MNTGGATVNRDEIVSMYAGLKRLNSLNNKVFRKPSKEFVDALIDDLNRQTWHNTYTSDDANIATSLVTFLKLYNKLCPS